MLVLGREPLALGPLWDRWQGWSGTSVFGRALVKVSTGRDGIWEFEMDVIVQWLGRIKTLKTDLLNELYYDIETGSLHGEEGRMQEAFEIPVPLSFLGWVV